MDRRQFLQRAALCSTVGLAGCLGETDAGAPTDTTTTTKTQTPTKGDGSTNGTTETTHETPTTDGPPDLPDDFVPASEVDHRFVAPVDGAVTAAPVRYGDTVVVGTGGGTLHGVDAASGEERWTYETPNPVATHATGGALTVAEGTCYAVSGRTEGPHGRNYAVHAVDPATGDEVWSDAPDASYHWLGLLGVADGTLYVGSNDDAIGSENDPLYGYDAATGERRFAHQVGDAMGAAVRPEGVYVTTYETLTALAPDGTERWTVEASTDPLGPVVGEHVYVGSDDPNGSSVTALDPDTGEARWTFDDWFVNSLAPGDDLLLGGQHVAQLTAGGEVDWRADDSALLSYASFGPDVVYGTSQRRLLAFGTGDGTRRWRASYPEEFPRTVGVDAGTLVAYGSDRATLAGLDADSGERTWATVYGEGLRPGTLTDGRFYFGVGDRLYARDL